MTETDAPEIIADYAAQTVEYVRRAVGIELTFDSETLPILDHYLRSVPEDKPETLTLVTSTAGAYFGEVVRRLLGGRWEADAQDPGGWRFILPLGVAFSPSAVVLAAIARESDADAEFHFPSVLRHHAEGALERMGEVSEDNYFSLCGRLDTLEHLHGVLTAVAAEHKAKSN